MVEYINTPTIHGSLPPNIDTRHCPVHTAVQALYHLKPFRYYFKKMMQNQGCDQPNCILCQVFNIFNHFDLGIRVQNTIPLKTAYVNIQGVHWDESKGGDAYDVFDKILQLSHMKACRNGQQCQDCPWHSIWYKTWNGRDLDQQGNPKSEYLVKNICFDLDLQGFERLFQTGIQVNQWIQIKKIRQNMITQKQAPLAINLKIQTLLERENFIQFLNDYLQFTLFTAGYRMNYFLSGILVFCSHGQSPHWLYVDRSLRTSKWTICNDSCVVSKSKGQQQEMMKIILDQNYKKMKPKLLIYSRGDFPYVAWTYSLTTYRPRKKNVNVEECTSCFRRFPVYLPACPYCQRANLSYRNPRE